MPQRTICIQSMAKVSVRQSSLIVESLAGKHSIPLEDIWVLILESHEVMLSSKALSAVVDAGIGLMMCGTNHMPNGLLLPIGAHSRHAAIVEDQLAIPKPLAKQLWKKIVVAKIEDQARVLDFQGLEGASALNEIAKEVRSGFLLHLKRPFSSVMPVCWSFPL